MKYIQHDKVTVIELSDKQSAISFDTLERVLIDRPTNIIYCELEGELYGIISMGDIARAGREGTNYAAVNRKFVQVAPNEHMKARHIFLEKENINAIPVVNRNNKLLGAYVRWNDTFFRNMPRSEKISSLLKKYQHVALVQPYGLFRERYGIFKESYENIVKYGGGVQSML